MADDAVLRRVLAAERAIVRRGVDDAREIPGGWVVRHPPLPDIWHLNRVHLTGSLDAITPDELVALADRWLGDAGHRRVTLDDVDAADALWPALEQRGWRRERAVVMVLGDPATRRTDDPRVSRLSEAELAALQPRAFADDAMVTAISETLPARLGAAQSALRAGTEAIGFGAAPAPGDPLAASVTLYLDPDVEGRRVALVDQVATLRSHREQGLATAAMAAAIGAAGRWRADTIALFADADDWPQVMYAAMGFGTVGRQVAMHRDV